MSASATPSSPLEKRDIRSDSRDSKRDKEHRQKWMNGQRPSAGVRLSFSTNDGLVGGSERQRELVRPRKQWSQVYVLRYIINPTGTNTPRRSTDHKSHANKIPKPNGHYDQARLAHKADALVDANDHTTSTLSKSLLELLPQHANNAQSPIQTAIRSAADAEILYSFDNKGQSPSAAGRKVDLGGLVEQAEKKWVAEQTEKIVKGEYEVLDNEGETTIIAGKRGRRSPKQKATKLKTEPSNIKNLDVNEDDGFELV
jgi:hypothetical protein